MHGVFPPGKDSCRACRGYTKVDRTADALGYWDEVMDIKPGYVISGIVQKSVDCIIAGKDVIYPVDEKNRDFERIKNIQEKGICAVYEIISLHIFCIITRGLLSGLNLRNE